MYVEIPVYNIWATAMKCTSVKLKTRHAHFGSSVSSGNGHMRTRDYFKLQVIFTGDDKSVLDNLVSTWSLWKGAEDVQPNIVNIDHH